MGTLMLASTEQYISVMKPAILLLCLVACATSYVVQPSEFAVGHHKNPIEELGKMKIKRAVQTFIDDVCQDNSADEDAVKDFCIRVAFMKLRQQSKLNNNNNYEDKCNSCRDDVCDHLYCTDLYRWLRVIMW